MALASCCSANGSGRLTGAVGDGDGWWKWRLARPNRLHHDLLDSAKRGTMQVCPPGRSVSRVRSSTDKTLVDTAGDGRRRAFASFFLFHRMPFSFVACPWAETVTATASQARPADLIYKLLMETSRRSRTLSGPPPAAPFAYSLKQGLRLAVSSPSLGRVIV